MRSRFRITTGGHRRLRAFTLLEMLLAIALIMALFAALFGFLWDMLSTRRRIVEDTSRRRAAAILIDGLERDLMTCLVGDSLGGAGVWGDGTTLRVMSRSVPVRLAERGARDAEVFADLELSEYRFASTRSVIEARRSVLAPGGGRRGSSAYSPLGGPIYKVRFRYHDGDAWRDTYDSLRADRLPVAVEVAIWFDPWPGELDEEAPNDDERAGGRFRDDEIDDWPRDRRGDAIGGGFDEHAFAEASDLDTFDEPRPDRVRVIVVPDATSNESENAGDEAEGEFAE